MNAPRDRDDSAIDSDATISELVALALKAKARMVTFALLGATIAVGSSFFTATAYTAVSSFTPQGRSAPSSIGGLAAQLGVPISAQPSQSPQFYAELVRSNELLRRAALANYGDSAQPVRLAELLTIDAADSATLIWQLSRWLERRVTAVPSARTGVVTLRTTAPTPVLAAQINAQLLNLMNQFNLESRQSQASAERKFAFKRMAELREELLTAEDAYQKFLERNRAGLTAPELAFQRGRHEREVALRQQVYTTMVEAHETARLDEVRDTPVITVIDAPRAPLVPDSRRRVLRAAMGVVLGTGLALALAWASAVSQSARKHAKVSSPSDLSSLT